jgi:hypothetical protein
VRGPVDSVGTRTRGGNTQADQTCRSRTDRWEGLLPTADASICWQNLVSRVSWGAEALYATPETSIVGKWLGELASPTSERPSPRQPPTVPRRSCRGQRETPMPASKFYGFPCR